MKTFGVIFIAFLAGHLSAQIPNNSFENWTDMGTYTNPESWGTLNNKWAPSTIFTASEGTPGNPGASYLKLTSRMIGPWVRNGIAVSGLLDSINLVPISGFPFTGQPVALTGQWQHMIFGSTQGGITVALTKWNTTTNTRDTVALADHTLDWMAMSWEPFSIPFVYYSLTPPDSCIIFMRASGAVPAVDDYLWIDDLAFSDSSSIGIEQISDELNFFSVFPNPVQDVIHFENSGIIVNQLTIYSVDGREVFNQQIENQNSVDVSDLPAGVYVIKVSSDEGIFTVKILKE